VNLLMILGKWPTWRTIPFFFFGVRFICRSGLHTKWSPTQSDIYQRLYWYNWFSWWWARGCSKHAENLNKYIEKNCASSWSFTKNNIFNSETCSISLKLILHDRHAGLERKLSMKLNLRSCPHLHNFNCIFHSHLVWVRCNTSVASNCV